MSDVSESKNVTLGICWYNLFSALVSDYYYYLTFFNLPRPATAATAATATA